MERTHDRPASSFGRLGSVTVIVGTGLYMAAISSGVIIILNAMRSLSTLPCGAAWGPCLLHP